MYKVRGGGEPPFVYILSLIILTMEYITERITVDKDLMDGKPTIRGMRITVQTILEYLGAGDSFEEILEQYPYLEKEDIIACLKFAVELVKEFPGKNNPSLNEMLSKITKDNLHGEI